MVNTYYTLPIQGSGDVISYTIEGNNADSKLLFQPSKFYTTITSLIKNSIIYPRYRIFVLNPDETVKYQIPQEDIISGGSYQENYQSGQRRSLSFSLDNQDKKYTPSINKLWVDTKFGLEIGLEIPSVSATIWFKKGVFIPNSLNPFVQIDSKKININCSDKFSIFEGSKGVLDNTYEIPVNTDIKSVIRDILATNTGDGYVMDSKDFIYSNYLNNRKTPLTITSNAGDNYGNILTQLATILSAEIFYNSVGNLVVIPQEDVIKDDSKPVIFDYIDTKGDIISNDFNFDLSQVVNKVYVLGSNVNGKVFKAMAENNNPASPINVSRIGYRTGNVINDTNITNEILAKERADYELRLVTIAKMTLNSSVPFNPLLSVNNLVKYTDEFFELQAQRFLIQNISFSLDYSGQMSLSLVNTDNLSFIA